MKKKLLAVVLSLGLTFSSVPAYAYSGGIPGTSFTTELYAKSGPVYTPPTQSINKSIDVTQNGVNIYVNGTLVNADNFVYNGTTYLPIRAIGDSMGAIIDYNDNTKIASITVPSGAEPVKDVQMSNHLITVIYSSDMIKYMFLIKDTVDYLPSTYSTEVANTLRTDIANLRAVADLLSSADIPVFSDIIVNANGVADNAELCLELVEKNNSTSASFVKEYGQYHANVANYAYGSLDILDVFNAEALDYIHSK